jgi:aspartyl-tRNA(Asn)/glutamyl-tRNA(Gln) amidotransferase subunit B
MPAAQSVDVFPVIGLEVHAQLATRSKMFCPCPVTFAAEPNTATCPVCLGLPGTLPAVNEHAVDLALRIALAIGGSIDRRSSFARKNYFYPDLPKGYQITQFERPLSTGGSIEIDTAQGERRIPLVRIHLEEDAGKSLHENPFEDVPEGVTLVEWNRAGVPLVEIVSEPELRSSAEAQAYLTELRRLLRALGVSEANMEEGNLRCDANVSVRLSETAAYGTRAEIKNLNSIRSVGKAIEFEVERQAGILASGGTIVQETRLYDAPSGRTRPMRSKEEAHDYRYFPEPDLGALEVAEERIERVRRSLPELPRARRARFQAQYGMSPADAETLASARPMGDYFEELASESSPRAATVWTTGEVLRWLKEDGLSPDEADRFPVRPAALAKLIDLVESGAVSVTAGKAVFEEMHRTGADAATIVRDRNLGRLSDEAALAEAVRRILEENPKQVDLYRAGKKATFGWFVGQAMKATGGRADPEVLRRVLERLLES